MKANVLFLNNKAMWRTGVQDMQAAIRDVEQAYILNRTGDVINPGKCVLRWGNCVEDENVLGRINAVGAGILDIAVAARCYRTAQKEGFGITLPFGNIKKQFF